MTECYPISILPNLSRLFLDFVERRQPLSPFYPSTAYCSDWIKTPGSLEEPARGSLCDLLEAQNRSLGAGEQTLANIARLRQGAAAVVTGQQVTLFGGPLLTLLKAATAIRKAADATAAGRPHVPIFWLASEDHDLAEVAHVTLPSRHALHRLQLEPRHAGAAPVGNLRLEDSIKPLLEQADELLGPGPLLDLLRQCYTPEASFSQAFGRMIAQVFSTEGLVVIDASSRAFHASGSRVLREAILRADELREALVARDAELAAAGYHSQVLVAPHSSLLFLIDKESGSRLPLKHNAAHWQAGRESYTEADLLAILENEPERLSPNALLRSVFQDCILPTSVYVGGPAEIAYFAQSQVLYECILGRTTPVLPRLSATLIEPDLAAVLARHELTLPDVMLHPEELAQRLGARSMPVEGKCKLAATGVALDQELTELTGWMHSLDAGLGRSADVAASKMRYQMNRLRRLAANYQLEREASLRRHSEALTLRLFPDRHPQERLIGAAWFLSRSGDTLPSLLVEHAGQQCPGHKAIWI